MSPTIYVNKNLPPEVGLKIALAKFKKSCENEGILKELRKRSEHIKPSARRKQKSLAAQRTARKLDKKRFRGEDR